MSIDPLALFWQLMGDEKLSCETVIRELARRIRREAMEASEWDGKERRCEHDMKWISDWYGDPGVINGTADCSRSECQLCGWVDPNGERPEESPEDYI